MRKKPLIEIEPYTFSCLCSPEIQRNVDLKRHSIPVYHLSLWRPMSTMAVIGARPLLQIRRQVQRSNNQSFTFVGCIKTSSLLKSPFPIHNPQQSSLLSYRLDLPAFTKPAITTLPTATAPATKPRPI